MKSRPIPPVGELRAFAPPAFERHRLRNGLDVVLVHKTGLPVVDVQLVLRGGARIDSPELAGRASLTAELLDEGTLHHSALEISDRIEFLGADFDLRVGWDASFLTLHGLVPRLGPMLDLLTEVMLEPAFPAEEFQRKHEERLHSLLQERAEPRLVAVKAVSRAVFGEQHMYGWPLAGTTTTMRRVDRPSVTDYYARGFAPDQAHLVLVGQINADQVLRELDQRLGGWAVESAAPPPLAELPIGQRTIYLIDKPGAAQSEVRIGHVGPPRQARDYFPLLVLNTVLGGSFKSRLNMILREEKGFTYGASSAFSFRRAGGLFSGGAAVFTDNTAETVSILAHEIARASQDGVSGEELERARRYLALGFVRTLETTSDLAAHLAELVLFDLEETYLQTYAQRIARVTRDQVAQAAQIHLKPAELAIVVVGDRARVLDPLQRLEWGTLVEWEAE